MNEHIGTTLCLFICKFAHTLPMSALSVQDASWMRNVSTPLFVGFLPLIPNYSILSICTTMREPESISAGLQRMGLTPAGFQESFRADMYAYVNVYI